MKEMMTMKITMVEDNSRYDSRHDNMQQMNGG